jgi:hypothetical protein
MYTETLMTAVRGAGHETRVIAPRAHLGHSDDVIGALSAARRPDLAALPAGTRAAAEMKAVLDTTLSIYRVAVQPMVRHPMVTSQPRAATLP